MIQKPGRLTHMGQYDKSQDDWICPNMVSYLLNQYKQSHSKTCIEGTNFDLHLKGLPQNMINKFCLIWNLVLSFGHFEIFVNNTDGILVGGVWTTGVFLFEWPGLVSDHEWQERVWPASGHSSGQTRPPLAVEPFQNFALRFQSIPHTLLCCSGGGEGTHVSCGRVEKSFHS